MKNKIFNYFSKNLSIKGFTLFVSGISCFVVYLVLVFARVTAISVYSLGIILLLASITMIVSGICIMSISAVYNLLKMQIEENTNNIIVDVAQLLTKGDSEETNSHINT